MRKDDHISMHNMPSISFDGLGEIYQRHRDDTLEIIDQVLTRGERLRSTDIEMFEHACADAVHREFAVAVGSGSDGLLITLRALEIGPGDEVIVPAFSFAASASCILLLGATPVFVDVTPDHLLMDLHQVKEAITQKTKAIIGVQLFGQCLDFTELESLAHHHGIALIEDAAQAFSSYYNGRKAGSLGLASVLSFDPSKVVPGLTTGGIICTDDKAFFLKTQALRLHGYNVRTDNFEILGYNSQMSAINAAVLTWQLSLNDSWQQARKQIAVQYDQRLKQIPQIGRVLDVNAPGNNYHKYVIQISGRWRFIVYLQKRGIPTRIHYSRPLPRYHIFQGKSHCIGELPTASAACARVLSLPIHPCLQPDQVDYILTTIEEYFAMT